MSEAVIVPIAAMTMVVALALGIPLVRALTRRWERESLRPQVPPEVASRLERIEHAVEAVAIEVERIAEGQRFATKLLSDRADDRSPSAPRSARGDR